MNLENIHTKSIHNLHKIVKAMKTIQKGYLSFKHYVYKIEVKENWLKWKLFLIWFNHPNA
jgi:hypothetical protein